jgi:hypothetical protein
VQDKILDGGSKGDVIRVVIYTVADKIESMKSNGADPVDCPTLLKTIVVSSFLSRSSDIILNA